MRSFTDQDVRSTTGADSAADVSSTDDLQLDISDSEVSVIDGLDLGDYTDRRTLEDKIPGLSPSQVAASAVLDWHSPDGQFDLDQYVEAGGYLFRHHRRRVGEILEMVKVVADEQGLEPHWRTLNVPLRAPLPPCTDARLVLQEGGNEGYKVHCHLTNRKEASGPHGSMVVAWDLWTTKYLTSSVSRLVEAVNDRIWDLGSTERAQEAWSRWHETERWDHPMADRMLEVRGHTHTDRVRTEESVHEWPRDIRLEVQEAAQDLGTDVVAQHTGVDERILQIGLHV
jgi:hypothetical protein